MNKLDDVLISNDPAYKIEIYLDCGAYCVTAGKPSNARIVT